MRSAEWVWLDAGGCGLLFGVCACGFVGQILLNRGHQVLERSCAARDAQMCAFEENKSA